MTEQKSEPLYEDSAVAAEELVAGNGNGAGKDVFDREPGDVATLTQRLQEQQQLAADNQEKLLRTLDRLLYSAAQGSS